MKEEHIIYILAGGNIGEREFSIEKAKTMISRSVGKISRSSNMYESEPWGFEDVSWFLNQVLEVRSLLSPLDLLHELQRIEHECERRRYKSTGYESRTLDLDILFYDQEIWDTPELKIPHPCLHKRRFTLIPLADLIPEYRHPVLGVSIADLLRNCTDSLAVRPYL